jgi:hypothetical protein
MPTAVTYPGVYIEEVPSGVRTITGVATSIALFIGWAPRGDINRAVRLSSFADYEREYGGLDRRSFLGFAVKQFFDNGGGDAYVIRLIGAGNADASVDVMTELTVSASSPGEWANIYGIRTTQRPAPDNARFKLEVLDRSNNDVVIESFENLSMNATDPRFPPNVINGRSRFIQVTATNAANPPGNATVDLDTDTTGANGTVLTPNTNDFDTALLAVFNVGGIADRIDLFNIVRAG